jgi:hypothetical protein
VTSSNFTSTLIPTPSRLRPYTIAAGSYITHTSTMNILKGGWNPGKPKDSSSGSGTSRWMPTVPGGDRIVSSSYLLSSQHEFLPRASQTVSIHATRLTILVDWQGQWLSRSGEARPRRNRPCSQPQLHTSILSSRSLTICAAA